MLKPLGNPLGAVRNPLGTGSLHRASGAGGESLQANQEETSFLQKGTKLTKILSEMMKDRIMQGVNISRRKNQRVSANERDRMMLAESWQDRIIDTGDRSRQGWAQF